MKSMYTHNEIYGYRQRNLCIHTKKAMYIDKRNLCIQTEEI